MYSQRNEEEIILANVPASGKFLDIGAFSPTCFSNTRALYERGWSGVLIEPSPDCFCGLSKTYANDSRIRLVNALVTPDSDALTLFYSSPDAVGTSNEANYAIWKNDAKFVPIYVPAIPINKVIATLGIQADFISLDTEGTSFDILRVLNLDALGCNLICVETDAHIDGITRWFEERRFKVISITAENCIAKRI